MMRGKLGIRTTLGLMLACTCTAASADMMTAYGTNGSDLFASATFEVTRNTLTVTLANISQTGASVPADLLSGVYFDVFGHPDLTAVSAVVSAGSTVVYRAVQPAGGDVGGEWAYRDDITGGGTQANGGQQYGVSSTGLDIFGPADRFNTNTLQNPDNVGGMDYNIVPIAGFDSPNAPLSGSNELIQHSVVFTFTMSGFDFGDLDPIPPSAFFISNVGFQYGTSLTEPYLNQCFDCVPPRDPNCEDCPPQSMIPEPSSMLLLLTGLGMMAAPLRRRKNA